MLKQSRGTPQELLQSLGKSLEFSRFPFAKEMTMQAALCSDFSVILSHALLLPELTDRTRESLLPLGEFIGRNELANQIRLLENTIAALGQEKEYWAEREQKRGGLLRRLGILCGILLVVLLL